jgi:hypothetical protein
VELYQEARPNMPTEIDGGDESVDMRDGESWDVLETRRDAELFEPHGVAREVAERWAFEQNELFADVYAEFGNPPYDPRNPPFRAVPTLQI